MAAIARRKKVTDPLDDKAKARIFGFSSGSEHSARNDDVEEDDSPCLSNLLCGFLDQQDSSEDSQEYENESDSDDVIDHQIINVDFENLNQALRNEDDDHFRNVLVTHVSKAIEIFWFVKSNGSLLRRNVMAFLRSEGYNAGICKTKWESCGGLTGGNYELIDVLKSVDPKSDRYFIDLNFADEFEIARQTNGYQQLLQTLPRVFIGKCDRLKRIVKIISDEARRSLKTKGLHLPPWRKNRFMQNKWFGPYRRTTNLIPANVITSPGKQMVKCRSVGFNAVNVRPLITRTR
ncbi:Sulfate/thiosulfate import ATP-binding protein [Heracleum sosnowskyi]|uniref:Sulfate/thiosulfate import ATP-binding protein n=1 Tax=Heracleum sosnowskyi TaxID=360622 RepID=A0AAD8J5I5_9APIA|nr:Sulfate/thiosulfate import ATP-binding protein [Heracleum sosnowskyi]